MRFKSKLSKGEISALHRALASAGQMLPCDKAEARFDGQRNEYYLVFGKGDRQMECLVITKSGLDLNGVTKQLNDYFVKEVHENKSRKSNNLGVRPGRH